MKNKMPEKNYAEQISEFMAEQCSKSWQEGFTTGKSICKEAIIEKIEDYKIWTSRGDKVNLVVFLIQ